MIPTQFSILRRPTLINNSPLSDSSLPIKNLICSDYKSISNYLTQQEITDLTPPSLQEAQIKRFNTLLTAPFIVKSKDDLFQFETSLQEIFEYLDVKTLEIIGGAVKWILGVEYMEEVVKTLKIPENLIGPNFYDDFKNMPADIDIRIPCLNQDPRNYQEKLYNFFVSKVKKEDVELVYSNGFTKYYTHESEGTCFSIASFGDRKDVFIDLIFVHSLKRKNLFKHDALKLDISTLFNKYNLNSHKINVFEGLILNLTKTLEADDVQDIDFPGCTMLFKYVTKGWDCSKELKNILIPKFLASKKYELLPKAVNNHFPNVPFASLLFCFNTLSLLPENSQDEIIPIVKALLQEITPLQEVAKNPLLILQNAMMCLQGDDLQPKDALLVFELITFYFQIFGSFFHMSKKKVENLQISNTSCIHLQFQTVTPLYIALENELDFTDINEKINSLPSTLKTSLFSILKNLSEYFVLDSGNDFNLKQLEKETFTEDFESQKCLDTAFKLLEIEDLSLNKIGFYLLSLNGIKEGNEKHLPLLLKTFLNFIKSKESLLDLKNSYSLLIKYWLASDQLTNQDRTCLESFYKALNNQNSTSNDLLKSFCLNFAKIEKNYLTHIILETWENQPEIFNDQSSFDLAEKLVNHSPRSSLKILHHLSQKLPTSKTKKLFDQIFNWYFLPKNKIFLCQNLTLLGQVTNQMILKTDKQTPLAETVECYVLLAKSLLPSDFVTGMTLLKTLEDKKIVVKGFSRIFDQALPEEKLSLMLQLNEKFPINFTKTSSQELEERLNAFLSCFSKDCDKINLCFEIFHLLENIVNHKIQTSKKFKELLKPKLEWILLSLLSEHKKDKKLLISCFKIIENFDHPLLFKKSVVSQIVSNLREILKSEESLENSQFVKEKINKLHAKNNLILSDEEFLLYEELTLSTKIEIAEEFLRKLFHCLHAKKEIPSKGVLNTLNNILNEFSLKKHVKAHLELLNIVLKLFPDLHILNENEHWKFAILNVVEDKEKIKLLLQNAHFFLKDPDLILEVKKQIHHSLIKTTEVKDKEKKEYFDAVLKLIASYSLNTWDIIENLASTLLILKNKTFNQSAFSTLQEMKTPLTLMVPLLESSSQNSEIYTKLLKDVELQLASVELEENTHLKKRIIYALSLNFLDLYGKNKEHNLKIYAAYLLLEKESEILSTKQRIEVGLKFIQHFINMLDDVKIHESICQKLHWLFLLNQTLTPTQELFSYFSKVAIVNVKNDTDIYLKPTLMFLIGRIDIENLPFLLKLVLESNSSKLFEIGCKAILKIIETFPFQEIEPIKSLIAKFIFECLNNQPHIFSDQLISQKLFTEKEICLFRGIHLDVLFNDKNTLTCEKRISEVLDLYLLNFQSPDESLQFMDSNLKNAVSFLTNLIFHYKNQDLYFHYLDQIMKVFGKHVNNSIFLKLIKSISESKNIPSYFSKEFTLVENNLSKEYKEIMRLKCFSFFVRLTQSISLNFFQKKNDEVQDDIMENIVLNNFFHINYLIQCFPEKIEDNVPVTLGFCYATTVMSPKNVKTCAFYTQKLVLTLLKYVEIMPEKTIPSFSELIAFTHLDLSFFKKFTVKDRADVILNMIDMIKTPRTITSYIVALNYLTDYKPALKAGLGEEKFHAYLQIFFKTFMLQFPGLTNDPYNYLKKLSEDRKILIQKKLEY